MVFTIIARQREVVKYVHEGAKRLGSPACEVFTLLAAGHSVRRGLDVQIRYDNLSMKN